MPRKLELKAIFRGVDRITAPLNKMQRRMARFTGRAYKAMLRLRRVTRGLARAIGTGLKRGIQTATVALVAFGAAAAKVIQVGATFEKTLVTAATRFPGEIRKGSVAFAKLEAAARKAGAETEFTATQAAEGLKFLGAAGFTAEQAIASLKDVIDFATSSELELADASKKAVLIQGAFSMGSKDAEKNAKSLTKVMDVMKFSTDSAAQEMEDVFMAMKEMAPIAAIYEHDIEKISSLLIGMAKAGIQNSRAGVVYKNIMFQMNKVSGKGKRMMKELGIQFQDTAGNMRDPIALAGEFAEALKDMGTYKRGEIMQEIFGKRAPVGLVALMKLGPEKLKEFEEGAAKAEGTVKSAAAAIRDTLGGSMDALKSVVESLIIDMFKLEDKSIKEVVDGIAKWIRETKKLIAVKVGGFLKDLIKKTKEFFAWAKKVDLVEKLKDGFEFLAKAIGFVVDNIKPISVLAGVILGIAAAVEVLTAVTAIMNFVAMANPMVLMFMAIAAISAFTVGAIIMNWDDIVYLFEEIGRGLKRVFIALWDFVLTVFNSTIGKIVYGPIHLLIGAYKTITGEWDPAKGFFENLWNGIVKTFKKAWREIKNIGEDIAGFVGWLFGMEEDVSVKAGITTPPIPGRGAPGIVSPAERAASFYEEKSMTTTQKTEITIKDDTGRAEVTGGELGTGMSMEPSGGFY